MGFLKALFPGADVAGNVVEKGLGMLDKAFYTDQEKAEDARIAKKALVDEYLRWLEATSGQNRARRALALLVASLWAFTWFVSLMLDVIAPWISPDISEEIRLSSSVLKSAASDMTVMFGMVMTFYFTVRPAAGLIDAFKAKHTKPKEDK